MDNPEIEDPLRPLSEEERRANLRALLGEDKADEFFDSSGEVDYSSMSTDELLKTSSNGGGGYRFLGIVALVFVLVMAGVFVVMNKVSETEEDIGVVPSTYGSSQIGSP